MSPSGTVRLRCDYRIGKRRETLTLGRHDATAPARVPGPLDVLDFGMSLSLAEARRLLIKAKRSLEQGVSPSRAKAEKKAAETDALTFGKWVERYFECKGDPKSKGEQLRRQHARDASIDLPAGAGEAFGNADARGDHAESAGRPVR